MCNFRATSDQRRHVFLIIKEALNNVVKHSGSSDVKISVHVDGGSFVAEAWDNGCGPNGSSSGNGLANMRGRAKQLGGTCEIGPAARGGTLVSLYSKEITRLA
jgi:signal transduction histidine kinase